jgi:zinc protease
MPRADRAGALSLALALAFALPARAGDAPFTVHTLPNGLTVLLAPSPAHPVIAVSAFVTTGGRTEDEYYQGSLHYIEHLVYKGRSPNLAPTEFRKRMSLLGREAGGWTWDDEINFGFEVPKEAFGEALGVFREALLDLQFEKDWFESEKLVVLQEMTTGREQPDDLLDEAWDTLAYDVHPYGRSVIGTEKAIRELDLEKTYRYYQDRFSPNHMILSVAGDFASKDMLRRIESAFGPRPRGPSSFELGLVEPEQRGPRRRTDFLPQASHASAIVGFVGPGGAHADTPALELLAALLNDRSVGLPQFLEEQEKWVTSVDATHYVKRDASDFRVTFRAEPEKAAAVATFVERFLLDLDATTLPADAFERARRSLAFGEALRRATAAERAERFGFLVSRRGADEARKLTERWSALRPGDVQGAKERWIAPRRLVVATVLPESFDPDAVSAGSPVPGAVAAEALPDLDAAGALRPAEGKALAYTRTDAADGVSLYTYANGLRLVVRRTTGAPLLAASGRVLGGQWVEPEGKDGINAFVAEAGMRATRRWGPEAFARLLRARSITASPHVSVGSRANTSRHVDYRDAGAHHYRGPAAEWPLMLACLKETLFFPEFPAEEVEKLRTDLVTKARLLPENQLEYLKQEFYRKAYAGHPYGRVTYGTETSLASIEPAELAEFHRACWTPARAVVSVVGDADPDEVAKWIAGRWADLPDEEAEPWRLDPARSAAAPAWSPPAGLQTIELGKDLWTVNWGRPGVARADAGFLASVVLGRMAGHDHFYKYVYGEGVSYRSWIRFWEHLGPGAWILENDVKRDRFDEICGMFEADLDRYSSSGFPRPEFDEAVQRLVNDAILDGQDETLSAWRLAVAEGDGAGFRTETEKVARLRAVRFEDVQDLARRVFAPDAILRVAQK